MLDCWQENPKARPSFTDLRKTFEELCESEGYIDFEEIKEDSIYYKVPSFNSQGGEISEVQDKEEETCV